MSTKGLKPVINRIPFRIGTAILAILILAAVYILQRESLLKVLGVGANAHPHVVFIFNRTLRLVLNDLACFLLIWAIFQERRYLKAAWYVFLLEALVILPIYFAIKLSIEGDSEISSPFLAQIHRMIVNPMLMFLLMVSFFYQRMKTNETSDER